MEQSSPSLLAQVAALITIGGVGIYLLGIICIAWPIYHRVTSKSLSVTLFAVSRVPRLMIAGYGLRIFRFTTLLTTFLDTILIALGVGVYYLEGSLLASSVMSLSGFDQYIVTISNTLLLAAIIIPALVFMVKDLFIVAFRALTFGPSESWDHFNEWLILILVGLPGFVLQFLGLLAVFFGYYFIGLIGIFLGMLLVGVSQTLLAYPPLPTVEITRIPIAIAEQALSRTVKGKLLDHVSGCWYFFDDYGALIALPDSQVEEARIHEGE